MLTRPSGRTHGSAPTIRYYLVRVIRIGLFIIAPRFHFLNPFLKSSHIKTPAFQARKDFASSPLFFLTLSRPLMEFMWPINPICPIKTYWTYLYFYSLLTTPITLILPMTCYSYPKFVHLTIPAGMQICTNCQELLSLHGEP